MFAIILSVLPFLSIDLIENFRFFKLGRLFLLYAENGFRWGFGSCYSIN